MRSTGYWVNTGDTLKIDFDYTGREPSPMPSVWIHSLDDNTWDYETDQKVQLNRGSNTIRAAKKGAVYIVVQNEPTDGIMTVDIASGGHPMPRFVLGQHSATDWLNMLQAYGNAPYAELASDRAMITLTLARARQYVDDPVGVLETWDRIIAFGEAQYGLALDNSAPNDAPQLPYHFVECVNCKNVYMYAWPYRTAYGQDGREGAIRYVANLHLLTTEGWGPWHELGHIIQHDDLTMDGGVPGDDVETTVNLTSLWVQTELFGLTSRLEADGGWKNIQNYLNQSSRDWDRQDNLFIRLGLFWQLHLAFGPTFYPRYARESRSLTGFPGGKKAKKQARVVIETSRVSGRNLIPFYEKWGMPITAATRREVEALHLRPLDKPIWENTDMSAPYTYYGPDDELPPVGDIVVPNEVHSGDRFSAVADTNSPGGHALTYQWNHGAFLNPQGTTSDTLTITAPTVQTATEEEISVVVSDGKHSSTFHATVLVRPEEPITPTITVSAEGGPFVAPAHIVLNAAVNAPGSSVRNVTFYEGVRVLGQDDSAPYSYSWNNVAAGSYQVTAKVTTVQGATAISTPLTVTVTPGGGTGECDDVAAWNNEKLYDTYGEQVADQGKIYHQNFHNQNKPPHLNNGYGKPWLLVGDCPTGPGPSPTNPTVSVSVQGEHFVAPANIVLSATATAPGSSVQKVTFYDGGRILGQDLFPPYSFQWNGVAAGSYQVTAEVTTAQGTKATSTPLAISVTAGGGGGEGCGGVPAWHSDTLYETYGERVADQGKIYHQNFYNKNKSPHLNNGYGTPWLLVGDCPASPAPNK
jgi:hypothetical protein